MSRQLTIFAGGNGEEEFFWCLRSPDESRYGISPLAELAAMDHDRLIILLAGEDVLVTRIVRPPGRESQSRKAVPFVLEERLAGEVDQMHVVSAPCDDDPAQLLVAALRRDLFESILAVFSDAGLVPDLVIPDFLALPREQGDWTLVLTRDRFLALSPTGTGAAMERESLAPWLRLLAASEQDGSGFAVYDCDGAGVDQGMFPRARVVSGPDPWQRLLARDFPFEHRLNLLVGDFRVRGRRGRLLPSLLILPLVLAFIWLGLLFISDTLDYLGLAREEARLTAAITGVYKKTFPGPAVVIDPRLQMEQKLKGLKGSGDRFLPLLAGIAPELLRANGFHLHRLHFSGQRLVLEISLASLAEMDRLRRSLSARTGREITTGQIRKAGEGVRGELRISLESKE